MFIPKWILILAGVFAALYLWNRQSADEKYWFWEDIKLWGTLLSLLIVLISIGFSIYLFWKHETTLASIVIIPAILAISIVAYKDRRTIIDDKGNLNEASFHRELKWHLRKIAKMNDLEKVRSYEQFAEKIRLTGVLYNFHENIEHYPSWYKDEKNKSWCSPEIKPEELYALRSEEWDDKWSRQYPRTQIENATTALIYSAHNNGQPMSVLFLSAWQKYFIDIYEGPILVFKGILNYEIGEYTDSLKDHQIHLFYPGNWLLFLYKKAYEVRSFQNAKSKKALADISQKHLDEKPPNK